MRRWKQAMGVIVSFALVAAMLLPMSALAGEQAIPTIRLTLGNGQTTPQYAAGETSELLIRVWNKGTQDAGNVKISPILDDAASWPFEIADMNNELELGTIPAGQYAEAVWKDLKVRDDVETKSYKLAFTVTYDDGENQFQSTPYIFAKTTAKPEEKTDDNNNNNNAQPETPQEPQGGGEILAGGVTNTDPIISGGGSGGGTSTASVPRVIVTGFNTDPGDVNAGSNFKLIIHLKNTSSTTAVSNMLFDLQAPASGTDAAAEAPAFLPASGSSSIYLDGIPAGGTKDISIDLNARADLVQKPYSIAMSMKYEDGNATQFESASSLAIPVKQAARFELSDIEVAPESVAVGEEANITCSLYNTGRIKLYNVKAKFEGEGLTGKEIFVGNIEPGATGSIDGIVTANQEMDETKKCKVVISYEDEAGKSASMEKEFPLTVTPAQNPADMMPVEAEAPDKGLPVVPIVIAVVVVAGIVTVVLLRRHKKKKMAALEEEDLLNEVDRFTEDE